MSYVFIDPTTKVAAVRRYWKTNNLKQTAEEFGVSRSTLYEWIQLVEAELEDVFRQSTPGKRTITLEEENQKLRNQLQDVLQAYHKSSQSSVSPTVPPLCPQCGSRDCVRNGKVHTKLHGIRQRYLCRNCGASAYVEVKKTL